VSGAIHAAPNTKPTSALNSWDAAAVFATEIRDDAAVAGEFAHKSLLLLGFGSIQRLVCLRSRARLSYGLRLRKLDHSSSVSKMLLNGTAIKCAWIKSLLSFTLIMQRLILTFCHKLCQEMCIRFQEHALHKCLSKNWAISLHMEGRHF
jgi:hypothetical protein